MIECIMNAQDLSNGIFDNISNEQYHRSPGISNSGLVKLSQSPAHYFEYLKNPPEPTAAMKLGSAIHSAILENGLDTQAIVQAPDVDKRTKDGKAQWQEFEAKNTGKMVLSHDDYERVEQITLAVRRHSMASKLLDPSKGKAEQSAFWIDPATGVQCRCRPDMLRQDGIVIDLKSTQDASVKEFQKTTANFKYHWQSAFYLDGLSLILEERLNQFVHLVVEKEPPYGIGIYVLDDASIQYARDQIALALAVYAKCNKENYWPGYPEEIQNLTLANWVW